jgi:hypothetical protein
MCEADGILECQGKQETRFPFPKSNFNYEEHKINKKEKEKPTKVIQDVWNADHDGNRL